MNILNKVSVKAFALGLATETFAEEWIVYVWGKRSAFLGQFQLKGMHVIGVQEARGKKALCKEFPSY